MSTSQSASQAPPASANPPAETPQVASSSDSPVTPAPQPTATSAAPLAPTPAPTAAPTPAAPAALAVPSVQSATTPLPSSTTPATAAPPASLLLLPTVAQSSDGLTKVTLVDNKVVIKDEHAIGDAAPKVEVHKDYMVLPPTAISLAPSSQATTTLIVAPLTPDLITASPVRLPVLAIPPSVSASEEHKPKTSAEIVPPRSPVERIDTLVDLTPHTVSRSRRNSDSLHAGDSTKTKPLGLPLPARPGFSKSASSSDLRSGMASPNIPNGAVEVAIASIRLDPALQSPSRSGPDPLSQITIRAGKGRKPFSVHRHLLLTKSPYFAKLFAHDTVPTAGKLTFDDIDEFGFAIFVRWIYGGELNGPKDFHSFTHYLAVYGLARRFDVEPLQNTVMDLCRSYYHENSMTAPAYRIEYVYSITSGPNHMRNFLVATAGYRCLCEEPALPGAYISDSLKGVLAKNGEIGVDFSDSLIKLSKDGLVDVRKGADCVFHVHSDGKICDTVPPEPYENP